MKIYRKPLKLLIKTVDFGATNGRLNSFFVE